MLTSFSVFRPNDVLNNNIITLLLTDVIFAAWPISPHWHPGKCIISFTVTTGVISYEGEAGVTLWSGATLVTLMEVYFRPLCHHAGAIWGGWPVGRPFKTTFWRLKVEKCCQCVCASLSLLCLSWLWMACSTNTGWEQRPHAPKQNKLQGKEVVNINKDPIRRLNVKHCSW